MHYAPTIRGRGIIMYLVDVPDFRANSIPVRGQYQCIHMFPIANCAWVRKTADTCQTHYTEQHLVHNFSRKLLHEIRS